MLDVSPDSLVYRDVRLNNAYVNSVCITNPLAATVEFTLRPSSQRYAVTPSRVTLSAGQSIVVTVRLFLAHYPNFIKGSRGQEDHIQMKSSYFEQKIPLVFFLHSRDTPTSAIRARSLSPMHRGETFDASADTSSLVRKGSSRREATPSRQGQEMIETLSAVIKTKDEKIQKLNETIGFLESKYPNWQAIVRNRIDQERSVFEGKEYKFLSVVPFAVNTFLFRVFR